MKNSTVNRKNNKLVNFSMVIAFTIALLTLAQAPINATETKPGNPEKQQTEAKLLTNIAQWLDGNPVDFERKTLEAMTEGMHKMGARMKALEAKLQAEIEALEKIMGFQTGGEIVADQNIEIKKIEEVKPVNLMPIKLNSDVVKLSADVPSLRAFLPIP